MYCRNCGTQYNQGETTCRQCGAALEYNNQQIPQPSQMVEPQQPVNNMINQQTINPSIPNPNGVYKLTINRPNNFVGCLVKFKVYIDNNEVGVVKNGEAIVVNVTSGNHTISFNNTMLQNLQISHDTSIDVGVIGSNKFGIINVKDSNGMTVQTSGIGTQNAEKILKSAKGPLIFSCSCIGITFILLFTVQMVISPVIYGISIGYSIINLNSIKQCKELLKDKYDSARNTSIIAIVVSSIGLLISLFLMI